jgi:hypothetical protein
VRCGSCCGWRVALRLLLLLFSSSLLTLFPSLGLGLCLGLSRFLCLLLLGALLLLLGLVVLLLLLLLKQWAAAGGSSSRSVAATLLAHPILDNPRLQHDAAAMALLR